MKKIGKFSLVDSVVIMTPNGQVWREVNETDLEVIEGRADVLIFAVKTAGLEFVSQLEHIFERVTFINPPVENGLVRFNPVFPTGDGKIMTTIPLLEFIGQSRTKGQIPEILYITRVISRDNTR